MNSTISNIIRTCIIFGLIYCIVCQQTKVVELTTDNFETLTSNGGWFIKFFAPWCGHCKRLAPMWQDLSFETQENIASVDCTQHNDICTAFGVKGFPTLKYLKNGKQYDYRGAREITNFVNFIEGGYLQSEGESLPSLEVLNAPKAPLPQYFEWALQLAVVAREHFYVSIIAVGGSFFVIGLAVGIMLDNCTRPVPRKVKSQ